jgi:hypothetical protein
MRHAVIGIVFMVAVIFIFPVIMNLLGVPYGEYARPTQIFQTIREIFETIFGASVPNPSLSPEGSQSLQGFSDF